MSNKEYFWFFVIAIALAILMAQVPPSSDPGDYCGDRYSSAC